MNKLETENDSEPDNLDPNLWRTGGGKQTTADEVIDDTNYDPSQQPSFRGR